MTRNKEVVFNSSFQMPDARPIVERVGDFGDLHANSSSISPGANFGSKGGHRSFNVIFDDGAQGEAVWQADVYHRVAKLIDELKPDRVIDFGCGNANKLAAITNSASYDVVAVDYRGSLEAAKCNIPWANLIECNFAHWGDTERVAGLLKSKIKTVIVVSDVIEHLTDPRPLLRLIRSVLAGDSENRLVISTPDRSLLGYSDDSTLPANKSHVREWTLRELCGLLNASGLKVISFGHVYPNQFDPIASTTLVECRYEPIHHAQQLALLGVGWSSEPVHVLVTTEYPGFGISGGIGAFIANQRRVLENSIVLLGFSPPDRIAAEKPQNVVWPSRVADGDAIKLAPPEDQVLEATLQLLFLLPDVRWVHYQDYGGIGCRIAQAKSSGILPDSVTTVAHCHGNTFYLENANEDWMDTSLEHVAEKEKIAVEMSDYVVFPTKFLRDLYAEGGIRVDPAKLVLEPYFYDRFSLTDPLKKPVSKVIFVGKRSHMKGFDLFVEAMSGDAGDRLKVLGITDIIVVGPDLQRGKTADLNKLKMDFSFRDHPDFDWNELCEFIQRNADDAIFVLPYRADNFPLAVLDVVAHGGIALSTRAGGIPEMLSHPDWNECLSDARAPSFGAKLVELVRMPSSRLDDISRNLKAELRDRSTKHPSYVLAAKPGKFETNLDGKATVLIPYYNTDLNYVAELIAGLNNQSAQPSEVIIVDDASRLEMVEGLRDLCNQNLRFPFRIISHEVNKGLAGARNTALFSCKTEFLLNLDSDDVPMNDWIADIVRALDRSPEAVAAVPYLAAFHDGSDYNSRSMLAKYIYRPLGEGAIAAQSDNILGHANSGVRVACAKALGGWGQHTKAKFEDWAFYLSAISYGMHIAIIPRESCLYRVRPGSMVRTYGDWEGQRRIATITQTLSRFDAVALQRRLRTLIKETQPPERGGLNSTQQIALLEAQLHEARNRRVARLADGLKHRLRKWPVIWKVTVFAAQAFWFVGSRVWRKVRPL